MENVRAKAAQLEIAEREEEVRVDIRAMDVSSGLCKLQDVPRSLEGNRRPLRSHDETA